MKRAVALHSRPSYQGSFALVGERATVEIGGALRARAVARAPRPGAEAVSSEGIHKKGSRTPRHTAGAKGVSTDT